MFFFKRKKDRAKCGFHARMTSAMFDCVIIGMLLMPVFAITSALIYGNNSPSKAFVSSMAEQKNNQEVNSFTKFIGKVLGSSEFTQFVNNGGFLKVIADQVIQFLLITSILVFFWKKKNATPGKMLLRMKIVDYKTGENPSTKQYIIRVFGYIISAIPLFLGYFWIIFNKEQRGWHDYLAGTKVISTKVNNPPASAI